MSIDIQNLDIEKLRKDLIDNYGTAMFMVSPFVLSDLTEVENASDEEVVKKAIDNKFDLRKYLKK